jgi:hypothetical protein
MRFCCAIPRGRVVPKAVLFRETVTAISRTWNKLLIKHHQGTQFSDHSFASMNTKSVDALAKVFKPIALVLLTVALAACSPRHLIVQSLGNELAGQGQVVEEDPGLAREASAFYLKLSESLLKESPGNTKLAESVCAGLSQYAFAFVAFEAEKLAPSDANAAYRMNERAKRLYLRAHRHAMAALELSMPGFAAQLALPNEKQWPVLSREQVGLAYWAAASWGGFISLSKDVPDAVADLPLAYRLAGLAWRQDHTRFVVVGLWLDG